ncbi:MAG: hypothetical protein FJ104_11355 [Deltaproteobacteria bacterium]|nr:hypothetical protein [Deltaproteobacteria bacterium]
MLRSADDLDAFLTRMDRRFDRVAPETFLVALGGGRPPVAIRFAPPVVVLQVDVGPAPTGTPALEARLFRRLLELNASDLLHVAYGLEQGRIVLDGALEAESLDLSELEAVLASFDLATSIHVPELALLARSG